MIPKYWQAFVDLNTLIGEPLEIGEGNDLSGLGGALQVMTLEQSLSEATECYPGIIAAKGGYVPVAMCLAGSGDYYYINENDGENGSLYRIYHDAVEDEKLTLNAVEKVLNNYEELLQSKDT